MSLCAIGNSAILESYARADAAAMPVDKCEALKLAREWHQKNLSVQAGLNLKVAFSNYGFRLKPVDKLSDGDRLKLQAWFRKWKRPILRFVRETWEDWHIHFALPDRAAGRGLPQTDRRVTLRA